MRGLFLFTVLLLSLVLNLLSVSGEHPSVVTLQVSKPSYNVARMKLESEFFPRNSVGVHLAHRDSPHSPIGAQSHVSRATRVYHRLRQDELRVKSIAAAIAAATGGFQTSKLEAPASSGAAFSSPLISGIAHGSGDYFARIGVGSPAKDMYVVADTGSDITWLQCAPCSQCYKQLDPLFKPARSSSYKPVACHTPVCELLKQSSCANGTNQCMYDVSYGDGSFTDGDLAIETLHFGNHTIPNIALGCGRNNQGIFHGAAGILGLGGGPLSFPSQTEAAFSYCLPTRESNFTTPLLFGKRSVPKSAKFTKLIPNKLIDSFYYVGLSGIRVGGRHLKIPADALSISPSGSGGVIVDSGTAITRLTTPVYNVLRDRFRALVKYPVVKNLNILLFDTCYNLSGVKSVDLPAVVLEFDGGVEMEMPAGGIMVEVDDNKTYCLAFAAEDEDFSIIGNAQQQTFRISIDKKKKVMGITPNQCQ